MLSKTSISSPSALAATAGEEFTGVSRGPPVILGLLFSIHPRRAATQSSGMTPHSLQPIFAPYVRQQQRKARALCIMLCVPLSRIFLVFLDGQMSAGEMTHM